MRRLYVSALFAATAMLAVTAFAGPSEPQRGGPGGQHMDIASMHKEFCDDHVAMKAAHLAYLSTKLSLTNAQRSSWDAYYQAEMVGARSEQADCLRNIPQSDAIPSRLDRQQSQIRRLQTRLQVLQSTTPTLQAFYQTLSDDQKQTFDRPIHHGHMSPMMEMGRHGGPGPMQGGHQE